MRSGALFFLYLLLPLSLLGQMEQWADPERMVDAEYFAEGAITWDWTENYCPSIYSLSTEAWSNLPGLSLQDAIAIKSFIDSLGEIKSIYELAYVPGVDKNKLIANASLLLRLDMAKGNNVYSWKQSLKYGRNELVNRVEWDPVKPIVGRDSTDRWAKFHSPVKLYTRYRWFNPGKFSFALLGETDPGEPMFGRKGVPIFDHISGHFMVEHRGPLDKIVLGDYRLLWGLGLYSWTGFGIGRGIPVCSIIPASTVLKPYAASNEYGFYRGIAVLFGFGNWKFGLYASFKKLDASIDSLNAAEGIRSVYEDGYHRTKSEWLRKDVIPHWQQSLSVEYSKGRWGFGLLPSWSRTQNPLLPGRDLYQQRNWSGRDLLSLSTYFKVHSRHSTLMTEWVVQQSGAQAIWMGWTWHPAPAIHTALAVRSSQPNYFSFFANGPFADGKGRNEQGVYLGLEWQPFPKWKLQSYVDLFRAYWPGYREDRPSEGKDFLVQLDWAPNRDLLFSTRWKNKVQTINESIYEGPAPNTTLNSRRSFRLQADYPIHSELRGRTRLEWSWTGNKGFFMFQDLAWDPFSLPFSLDFRLSFFLIDDFESRIYAFEATPLYQFGLPAMYGKGFRYYSMINWKAGRNFQAWVRISNTSYFPGTDSPGERLSSQWEFDFQTRLKF